MARIMRGARMAAGILALTAWVGLALQLWVSLGRTGSLALSLWILSRYFTILANLAVALVFTGVAGGSARAGAPSVMAGLTLAILLVGIVYRLLLYNFDQLRGMAALADLIVHVATPTLVPLFWLAFVPKGRLTWGDPLRWAALPLLYLGYALARGTVETIYAYPFIDVGRIGWAAAAVNVVAIALGFVTVSLAAVALDARLAVSHRS